MDFAAQKMLTGDRARLCSKLIFLALFAGPALYGQSELTATGQRTVPTELLPSLLGMVIPPILRRRIPTWEESPRALPVQRRCRFRWKRLWLVVYDKTLGGCFLAMPFPARKANGGGHSAHCCQI